MENLFNMAIVSPDDLFAVYHYIGSPFYAQVDLEPGMIIPYILVLSQSGTFFCWYALLPFNLHAQ